MRSETPSVEVQEKVDGVWRTVWSNGIPVHDRRRYAPGGYVPRIPFYVVPGKFGATFNPQDLRINSVS